MKSCAGFALSDVVTGAGEIASAEVASLGLVKRIQHLEGNIVFAIGVREGKLVHGGHALHLTTRAALSEGQPSWSSPDDYSNFV